MTQWTGLQVCRLLTAAHSPSLLCLQGLCEIAIYIEGIFEESEPVHFFTGGAKGLSDSSTSAALVLDAVGQLASSGIFPALKKVTLAFEGCLEWPAQGFRMPWFTLARSRAFFWCARS